MTSTRHHNHEREVLALVDRERFFHGLTVGLRLAAATAVLALAVRGGLWAGRIGVSGFFWYAASGVALVGVAAACCCRRGRMKTAAGLDARHASGSRLEAAVVLADSGHPLREVQLSEAARYFQDHRISYRRRRRLLPPLLALAVLLPLLGMIPNRNPEWPVAAPVTAKQDQPEAPAEKTAPKTAAEAAELSFVAPEAEMRAKPMDEIAFEGQAVSRGGFSEITLHIAVNAVPKKTVRIGAAGIERPGRSGFTGEFCLDELEVTPFDLVMYYLSGYCRSDREKRRQVVSAPQFIEVRPFREDAALTDLPPGGMNTDMIVRFLNAQIALNRSAFVARSAADRVDSGALRRELDALGQAQDELGREVDEYIRGLDPKIVPPETFYAVRQAVEKMRLARRALAGAVKEAKP